MSLRLLLPAVLVLFLFLISFSLFKGEEEFVPASEVRLGISQFDFENSPVKVQKRVFHKQRAGTVCTNDRNCPAGQACCFDLIPTYNGTCYNPNTTFCCVDDGTLLTISGTSIPSLFFFKR